jgi:hypothetical protein
MILITKHGCTGLQSGVERLGLFKDAKEVE